MIKLTHLNNREFHLNSELILYIENTPDTLIVMTNGAKIMVRERAEDVVNLIVAFKQKVFDREAQLNIVHQEKQASPPTDED